jgi:hypothetical protein
VQFLGDCNEITKMPEFHRLTTIRLRQLGTPCRHRGKIGFDSDNSGGRGCCHRNERSRGIWTNLFGGSKKNSEENSEE